MAGDRCIGTDAPSSTSTGNGSFACGLLNTANFTFSTAFGYENTAGGNFSSAFGFRNTASSEGSIAFGSLNTADGTYSSAFGYGNNTAQNGSSAFGTVNKATGIQSSAFGTFNNASGALSNAFGHNSAARGIYSSALGHFGTASGAGSIALSGWYDRDGDGFTDGTSEASTASGLSAVAVGAGALARGDRSTVVGVLSTAAGSDSSAFGFANTTLGDGDAAVGSNNSTGVTDFFSLSANNAALGVGNTATGGFAAFIDSPKFSSAAVGAGNQATGGNSSALGVENIASGINSTAIGYSSVASADDSTAIGSNSVADRVNTLSVGAVGAERQIVNVAGATQDTDAVNLSQLYPVATALGGGASFSGGAFTAPTYVIQNNNFNNVGSAFGAVDTALTDINNRIIAVGGVQGEQGDSAYEVAVGNGFTGTQSAWLDSLRGTQGPAGPGGPEGPAGGGPRSVVYDSDDQGALTLGGAIGTRLANVANGVAATDAANLGQVQAGDADTLATANTYTDNTATETLTSANEYTDARFAAWGDQFSGVEQRFQQQDRRIDRQGAMAGAYAGMATNTSGLGGRNRIGVGVGAQGGEQALAVGYQRALGNRASVSLGGAFSGSEKSVSAGAGFSW
jgi:autotransporter adhesin